MISSAGEIKGESSLYVLFLNKFNNSTCTETSLRKMVTHDLMVE